MIDIKDLQIGNKVLYQNKVVEIATTHITGTVGILNGSKDFIVSVSCKDIVPIYVTKSSLISIGFKPIQPVFEGQEEYQIAVNDCFVEIRNGVSNSINRNWFCHIDNISHSTIGGFEFQYLHELQNGIRLITKGDLEVCL